MELAMENSDEVRFQHYFISLVEQVAKPLFVDSCEEARSYGLTATWTSTSTRTAILACA